jgi:hypothetical protein
MDTKRLGHRWIWCSAALVTLLLPASLGYGVKAAGGLLGAGHVRGSCDAGTSRAVEEADDVRTVRWICQASSTRTLTTPKILQPHEHDGPRRAGAQS